jgi:hypothetical protein
MNAYQVVNQNFTSGFGACIKLVSYLNDQYEKVECAANSIVFSKGKYTGTILIDINEETSEPYLSLNLVYMNVAKDSTQSEPLIVTDGLSAEEIHVYQSSLSEIINNKILNGMDALDEYIRTELESHSVGGDDDDDDEDEDEDED